MKLGYMLYAIYLYGLIFLIFIEQHMYLLSKMRVSDKVLKKMKNRRQHEKRGDISNT